MAAKAKKDSEILKESIRPSEAVKLIEICMLAKRPVYIHGSPGIGKSEIVEQIAKMQGRQLIDMRLLLNDPTDLKGLPYYCPETKSLSWAKPTELPPIVTKKIISKEKKKLKDYEKALDSLLNAELRIAEIGDHESDIQLHKILLDKVELQNKIDVQENKVSMVEGAYVFQNAILFLDELNAAPPSVQASAYQLILNRRVGEYRLPEGIDVIAAGNKDTDRGVTYRIPTPLSNRFVHFTLEPDFEDWQKWAVQNNVHASVIGYLTKNTSKLFSFDPTSNKHAFATPRTWVFVSDILSNNSNIAPSLTKHLVSGSIGLGEAHDFMQHLRFNDDMPDPMDILEGKVKTISFNEISPKYSLGVSLCYSLKGLKDRVSSDLEEDEHITTEKFEKYANNFFGFIIDNFSQEMCVLCGRILIKVYGLRMNFKTIENFKKFIDQNKYLLVDEDDC